MKKKRESWAGLPAREALSAVLITFQCQENKPNCCLQTPTSRHFFLLFSPDIKFLHVLRCPPCVRILSFHPFRSYSDHSQASCNKVALSKSLVNFCYSWCKFHSTNVCQTNFFFSHAVVGSLTCAHVLYPHPSHLVLYPLCGTVSKATQGKTQRLTRGETHMGFPELVDTIPLRLN